MERESAAAHYRQALALAEEPGMHSVMTHCYFGPGRLYATIGRRAELSAAVEFYREMGTTLWPFEAALVQMD
jgi:hypothetical protein